MTCTRMVRFGLVPMLVLSLAALPAQSELRVVTTTPGLADIVKQIGGEYVSVEAVMRGPENVHNVQPKPSHMMKLKRADLFVHSGLDIEAWAELLIKGSHNSALLKGGAGNVNVSAGIALKEVPPPGTLTRAEGDIHVFGNPHYALDPLNGIIIARTITDALSAHDAAHAADFEQNYQAFAEKMRALTERLQAKLAPYRGARVVVYHRTWPYFLERFGLEQAGEVEPKPGISPGPQHLSQCVETMKAEHVHVVIVETYNSRKNAEFVAQKAGGVAVVLAQEVEAIEGVDTYEELFEYNVNALVEAFEHAETAVGSANTAAHP